MAHTIEDKTRLLQRVRRLRGQVDAIERALERDADCARVMQLTVSARGAANSLMAKLLEDHIRMHVSDPARDRDRGRARGAKHLIDIVLAYLRSAALGGAAGFQSPPSAFTSCTVALARRMSISAAVSRADSAALCVATTSR